MTCTVSPQPAARPRRINAEHLKLALVASNAGPGTRWAAMSDGAATAGCHRHQIGGGYLIHEPPLFTPLMQGHMLRLLDRTRSQGRGEVLQTWRTSIALLTAEFNQHVLRTTRKAVAA